MAGKIRELIDTIIQERSKGNSAIAETTKAKLILKGINPNKYDSASDDDQSVIEKLYLIAEQFNIKTIKKYHRNIIHLFSNKFSEHEVVSEIKNRLTGFDLKMLIYFASPIYKQEKLCSLMSESFKNCTILGCSTAGEIFNGELLKDSVVVMAFSAEIIADVKVEVVQNMKDGINMEPAFKKIEKHFNQDLSEMDTGRFAGLVLIDGLSMRQDEVMDSIGNRTDVIFAGGAAGDDVNHSKSYVYANGKVYTDSAVLAVLKLTEKYSFSIIKTQSFRLLDKVFTATKVNLKMREVIEFNNRPAAVEYAEAVRAVSVSEASLNFDSNPLGLLISDDILVRTPLRLNGNSIQFYCNIFETMEVRLLESTDIIEDTKKAVEDNINKYGHVEGMINFNCLSRTRDIEKKNIESKYSEIYKKIPVIGFSTFGEEYIGHMNQTSVMVVFRAKT